jgi:sec-independent protein translocase protein TatA
MNIGIGELIVIFLIILVLFGAKRLPEIGNALGKAIKEFRKASKEMPNDGTEEQRKDNGR